ncbi:phage tail protein [Pseudomonas sp. S04]|uniref:phage tail-collar fiber domain-containing protein n=1 Tax=unclassified Pseudomonas TaxID=196821 RepID=UPI00132030CB|nr:MULTISPECIES: phage tail protein [unclassified Pseudomonas]QHD01040.1 phage tail protein [Pseudomonas sp. S04]QHF33524.1 phage tail protein [Pseudomonas sp. S19]
MSTPLQPVITKAGLAAILRADNTGISAQITHIALGSTGYRPDNGQKSLVNQVAKFPISGGERLSSTLLHLTALADGTAAYWVREVGFLLSDGTLLAVWSHPTEALTYKSANTDLLLAYDLSLAALPANSVTIVSGEAGLSLSLAEPLAAQAAALIAEQLRGLKRSDAVDQETEKLRIVGERINDLSPRMKAAELRQDADREMFAEVHAAQAGSLIAEQLRGLKQQDLAEAEAEAQRVAGEQIYNLLSRMKVAEQRQDADRSGLLSAVVSNAAATVALQTLIASQIHGA